MEKVLKNEPELAQMLVKHFLTNGDKERLSKINFAVILQQNLDFTKELLRSYLEKNSHANVSLIVDALQDSNESESKIIPKPNSRIQLLGDGSLDKFISVIQKVIDGKHYYHYVDENQVRVWQNSVKLLSIVRAKPEPLFMKQIEKIVPKLHIKYLFDGFHGKLEQASGQITQFFGCQKRYQSDGVYTICWSYDSSYDSDSFRYLSFNQDGVVIDGKRRN